MALFDGVVLVAVLFSGAFGLWRGFTRDVLGLLSWMSAAWITLSFLPALYPLTLRLFGHSLLALAGTGALLFLFALVALLFLVDKCVLLIQGSFLRRADHLFGLAFGLLKGFFLVCAVYWGACFFLSESQVASFSQGASTAKWVQSTLETLGDRLAQDRHFQTLAESLKQKTSRLLDIAIPCESCRESTGQNPSAVEPPPARKTPENPDTAAVLETELPKSPS